MASENEGVVEHLREVLEIRLKEHFWRYSIFPEHTSRPNLLELGVKYEGKITRNLGALIVETQR